MTLGPSSGPRNNPGIWEGFAGHILLTVGGLLGVLITLYFTLRPNEPSNPKPEPLPSIIAEQTNTVEERTPASPVPRQSKFLTEISVLGNSQLATEYHVEQSGLYSFQYAGGAYSTSAPDQDKTWLTTVLIYKNSNVEWANDGRIRDELAFLKFAEHYYFSSETEAESIARASVTNDTMEVKLTTGDRLAFVAIDRLGYYSDNLGEVLIDIFLRSP